MAAHQPFREAPFPPDLIGVMVTVFNEVTTERGLAARDDAICDLVAQAILHCAHRGCRDPAMMRRCAHEALGIIEPREPAR